MSTCLYDSVYYQYCPQLKTRLYSSSDPAVLAPTLEFTVQAGCTVGSTPVVNVMVFG